MSTLTDILHESIAAVEVPGRPIDTHSAARHAVNKILANFELNVMAVTEWATVKVQSYLKTGKRRGLASAAEYVMARRAGENGADDITMLVPRQRDFWMDPFKLFDAHKIEGGAGLMQMTENATMPEFKGFVGIRDKQIAADIKYRNRMARALERLTPIWSVDPMMTYREACDFYVRQHGMPVDVDEDDGEEGA
jgi:hypothetical protein